MRQPTFFDIFINNVDTALRSVCTPQHRSANRTSPAKYLEEYPLKESEKKHTAGLMRVNHSGEVCAQALYQGQAITARLGKVREQMQIAADEEVDHLAWCEQRLSELNSKTSIFNPIWYSGSLLIGMLAGAAGDKWSLGFVAETEKQVTAHLNSHLSRINEEDQRTRAILNQMKIDEENHAQSAIEAGAADLPMPIKALMGIVSKIMTRSSYYL